MAAEHSGQRQQSPQETHRSPAYAFWVASIALAVAALAFILTMFIFGGLFDDAATVTAALGSLFTLIGTVVGALFRHQGQQRHVRPGAERDKGG